MLLLMHTHTYTEVWIYIFVVPQSPVIQWFLRAILNRLPSINANLRKYYRGSLLFM